MTKRGFTLIEILVVLSISALVFIGGYAGYRDFTRRQILGNAQEEMKSDLVLARQRALSGETPSGCNGNFEGYRLSLTFLDPQGLSSYSVCAKCSVSSPSCIKTVYLPMGITIPSGGPSQFIFKPLGQGTNLSSDLILTLTQSSTGSQKMIKVTTAGTIN